MTVIAAFCVAVVAVAFAVFVSWRRLEGEIDRVVKQAHAAIAQQETVIQAQSDIIESQAKSLHDLRCEHDGMVDLTLQCLCSLKG
jgi:hypothetical protein